LPLVTLRRLQLHLQCNRSWPITPHPTTFWILFPVYNLMQLNLLRHMWCVEGENYLTKEE
jgi:hypothetical protein